MNDVIVEHHDRVAVLTRNRPPLNLTSLDGTRELDAALGELAEDPRVRVVVLTGAGDRFFGAGSDLTEFPELLAAGDVTARKMIPENASLARLEQLLKPTVAALNGSALGGGLELALCCDFLIAEEQTVLGLPEINLGLFPGDGGPVRVARRIGSAKAKRMTFLGQPVPAETALAWGLVDEVVARGQALGRALELGRELALKPPEALAACKKAVGFSYGVDAADAAQQALGLFEQVFHSADGIEGVRAFLAKDTPRFTH